MIDCTGEAGGRGDSPVQGGLSKTQEALGEKQTKERQRAQFEHGECETLPSEMPARWLEVILILRSQIWMHMT